MQRNHRLIELKQKNTKKKDFFEEAEDTTFFDEQVLVKKLIKADREGKLDIQQHPEYLRGN